jgi:Xaa-Pro aminopeptidase
MSGPVPTIELPPPPDADALHAARLNRLDGVRDLLARYGLTVGLIGRRQLIRHLAGARVTSGVLAVSNDDAWLGVPAGSADLTAAAMLGIETIETPVYDADCFVEPTADLALRVADELTRHLPGLPIGAELAHLPAAVLGDRAPAAIDIGPLLDADRAHKDPVEVAAIRRAVAAVDRALAAAAGTAAVGATERDLERAIVDSLQADVGDDFELASNIASGERTAADDPHATDRALRPGDLVLLDLYPVIEGVVADLTRTLLIGEASPLLRARHRALVAALEAGIVACRPGVVGSDVDGAIRAALTAEVGDLAGSMHHHAGHGIGVFAWERPWIGRRSADRIEHGAVVCIEPGLYEPGVGGMRLEGQFSLTNDGLERLDAFPDDLALLAV